MCPWGDKNRDVGHRMTGMGWRGAFSIWVCSYVVAPGVVVDAADVLPLGEAECDVGFVENDVKDLET